VMMMMMRKMKISKLLRMDLRKNKKITKQN